MISPIALPLLRDRLRLALAVLRERSPHVVAFLEFAFAVAADVAFVAACINQFTFCGHDACSFLIQSTRASGVPDHTFHAHRPSRYTDPVPTKAPSPKQALSKYRQKRDFSKSPEPSGNKATKPK